MSASTEQTDQPGRGRRRESWQRGGGSRKGCLPDVGLDMYGFWAGVAVISSRDGRRQAWQLLGGQGHALPFAGGRHRPAHATLC